MFKLPAPSLRRSLAVVACAALMGCTAASTAPPTGTPPAARPSPEQVEGGTITLTDDGCTWEGNPGPLSGAQAKVEIRNETDDFGAFFVHRLKPEFTWQDGVDAIAAIVAAHEAGEDWPNWASNLTSVMSEATADAGATSTAVIGPTAGIHGVVCSASTDAYSSTEIGT